MTLKQSFYNNIINIPGWRTLRKIVVIESDDWGSIRMPSKAVYNSFIKKGFPVDKGIYNRYDSLESEDDLTSLYETLLHFTDINSNPVIFTANCIVANPDFARIKASGFEKYYYEPVAETFKKYALREKVIQLWKEGIENKIFIPQSHGREHLNVTRWMNQLRKNDSNTIFCFDNQTTYSGMEKPDYNYMEALDFDNIDELTDIKNIVSDGLGLFKQLFGYSSSSFIAPCYTWPRSIEEDLKKNGVKYIQGGIIQLEPRPGNQKKYKKIYHYLGEKSNTNQLHLVRNCEFEPTSNPHIDSVDLCLKQVKSALRWHKPAIIGSHRINYIGGLDEANRTNNLLLLKQLISRIQKQWPDVEFMSSYQLGDLISSDKK